MDGSSVKAVGIGDQPVHPAGGTIEVTAKQVALSNHSTIDASVRNFNVTPSAGHITFNVGTFSAKDSAILAPLNIINGDNFPGGVVTIQGLQGSGTFAHAVSLTNTEVNTSNCCLFGAGGSILIQADHIALNQSTLNASGGLDVAGGLITLVSRGGLDIRNSSLVTTSGSNARFGGTIDLNAGTHINLIGTIIDAHARDSGGGSITMAASVISLRGSRFDVGGANDFHPISTITLTWTRAVCLSNGTVLSADGLFRGGTIQINGGARFTSRQSTISAHQGIDTGSAIQPGGTIQVKATTVKLVDTQLTTSTSGGPQSVGGSITVEAHKVKLKDSQILSTATEGHGRTIDITSPVLNRHGDSVIDASSQSGTNGTVTINGIFQP
jgi:hypothetical protein